MTTPKTPEHSSGSRSGAHALRTGPARLRVLLALPAAAAAAAALAACSSSGSSSAPASPSSSSSSSPAAAAAAGSLKTAQISGATVLASSTGFTLYSFAPDTPTTSKCNGACAANWPPVKGPVSAAGVTGTFSTIKRSDGSVQASFDGHPLYTFTGDSAPGQANGNGLNAAGGVWHEITTSGTAPAGGTSPSSGGGNGY
jgi:predicted lipoprotein with Yx(FWY)xxD motif